MLYFIDTLKFKDIQVDKNSVQKSYHDIASFLKIDQPNMETLNYTRTVTPTPKVTGKPNVVIVVMESLVAQKTGMMNNPLKPTPHIDQLLDQSLVFERFYVPSQATARSMFCLVTGIPDVTSIKSGSRNPLIVNQHTIMNELTDYDKYYFLGGSASWGNIRGIFSNNIDGIKIIEEGSYDSPRTDVWGLSDYHLFIEADKVFKEKKEPFFAVIQTSSFHRPYSIPEERGDFKVDSDPEQEKIHQDYALVSMDEYNSLRFSDYALETFIELSKQPWRIHILRR